MYEIKPNLELNSADEWIVLENSAHQHVKQRAYLVTECESEMYDATGDNSVVDTLGWFRDPYNLDDGSSHDPEIQKLVDSDLPDEYLILTQGGALEMHGPNCTDTHQQMHAEMFDGHLTYYSLEDAIQAVKEGDRVSQLPFGQRGDKPKIGELLEYALRYSINADVEEFLKSRE